MRILLKADIPIMQLLTFLLVLRVDYSLTKAQPSHQTILNKRPIPNEQSE